MEARVVSASRRTDIPAFYVEWLLNRLREGYCLAVNPFNPRQVARVSLRPEETVLVLWTRDPRPLLPSLPELDDRGFRYYFLFTLTGYGRQLEPGLPPLEERLEALARLSARVGPTRVVWRYDPVILGEGMGLAYHVETFAALARALENRAERVIVSFFDAYPRAMRRLKVAVEPEGPVAGELLDCLAGIAHQHGMELQTCAETLGPRGKCIDDALIQDLFGVRVSGRKDPNQRPACGCVESRDIGAYDTCLHACLYCYATRGLAVARRNHGRHDARAPWLLPLAGEGSVPPPGDGGGR